MTTTTFDPTSTATSLAQAYTSAAQTLLTNQTNAAAATAGALTKLQSALNAFDGALSALSSATGTGGALAHSATFNDASVAHASASSTASAGTYAFFVEQLATADQVAYTGLDAVPASQGGPLTVQLAGGQSFAVDLSAADLDGDGKLSAAEIGTAINAAPGNDALVTASVLTAGGHAQLVLGADATGAAGAITLDASALPAGALKTSLGAGNHLVAAQDAVVWLGAQGSGIRLQQASNTFDAVSGVSITFDKAMSTGAAPVTLTVATDQGTTAKNVQGFVDAYNTLEGVLDGLTAVGNAASNTASGPFADDSAVRSLRSRLQTLLRQNVGGDTLAAYGVTANTDGTLALDSSRLQAKLAIDPSGLQSVLGSTSLTAGTGVLGAMDATLRTWTNATTGLIKQRQDGVTRLQSDLTTRQGRLDGQYNSAYARYLQQFTTLQTLQSQMSQTTSLFDALFGSNGDNG